LAASSAKSGKAGGKAKAKTPRRKGGGVFSNLFGKESRKEKKMDSPRLPGSKLFSAEERIKNKQDNNAAKLAKLRKQAQKGEFRVLGFRV